MSLLFSYVATVFYNDPNTIAVDDISINLRCGIVEGKNVQLKATLSPGNVPESLVKWSTSNPDVISCTDG